ncbi:MAG: PilZ domain-containing protein, partial [Acidimicrobiia bacterium]|nr:PilZ domain-containing protein [Acidimicrobiia bacterium]
MSQQLRRSPRRPTIADAVLVAGADSFEGVITDLSADGAFIRVDQELDGGDAVKLAIVLPTGGKSLNTRARVVRAGLGGLGVRFEELSALSRSRLLSYSVYYDTDETIVHLQKLLGSDLPSNLLPLGEHDEIVEILDQAVDQECEITLFEEVRSSARKQTCRFLRLDSDALVMDQESGTLHLTALQRSIQPTTKVLYLAFSSGALFYAFEAIVLRSGSEPTILLPERIYLSERRSQRRLAAVDESWIKFPSNGSGGTVRLPVSDLTDRGASLLLPAESLVVPGMRFPSFELHDENQIRPVEGATVRHVSRLGRDEMVVG